MPQLPGSYKGIIQAVNQLGKPLQHILLTHAHGDHVGSLDTLAQTFPHAKVMISERDSFLLQGDTSLRQDEPADAYKRRYSETHTNKASPTADGR
ncbi:metal-dependent hydrolase [Bacillus subtilis]|nr:metal-dependent hydrolase [Bacillus subtilis]